MTAPATSPEHAARPRLRLAALVLAALATGAYAFSHDAKKPADKAEAAPSYARDIQPLIQKYCLRCHSADKAKGGVKLDGDKDDAAVLKNRAVWEKVADNLRHGDMPPAGAKRPTAAETETLNRWFDAVVLKVDCDGPRDPGRVTIRRLNRAEYNNTVRDLTGVSFQPAKDFPADDVGYGFDNIGDVLSMPPLLMEKYLEAAEAIVNEVWKRPDLRKRIMVKPQAKGSLQENLKLFASRAYRRPATDAEVQRLMQLVQAARRQGDAPDVGVRLAVQAILASPHFLFRVEADRPGKAGGVAVSDWELASRLSYFLWSTMPDEELFRLCREGKLSQPATLEAQVKRMLKDSKSQALAANFAGQWLQLRSLEAFSPDPKRFPRFNAELRKAMVRETEQFFMHVVKEDRGILDFLEGDYSFLNERLARHYGIADVTGEHFRKVSLKGTARGGVLTHASVLSVTSNPTRTSPVKRGKWVLDNILGTPPPPPPPDVDELPEGEELTGTLRQQMEQHRTNPSCASCHQRMDPLGFGLENFDAVGAWRDREGKHKVDATGVLPDGSKFDGPAQLREVLVKKKDLFVKCFVEKMLTYALGRGMERSDRCFIEGIAKAVVKDEHRFSAVVMGIVKSDPFLKRRAKGDKK